MTLDSARVLAFAVLSLQLGAPLSPAARRVARKFLVPGVLEEMLPPEEVARVRGRLLLAVGGEAPPPPRPPRRRGLLA